MVVPYELPVRSSRVMQHCEEKGTFVLSMDFGRGKTEKRGIRKRIVNYWQVKYNELMTMPSLLANSMNTTSPV
jgi:hypothetical protein